ncbi:unnamed protein product [Strongylus vulgaris]|uniref:Uncharacterized protein n=1 Tax=Strongylus vulgaris TaxID=40348 RepID=A0A3P7J275_STRVU|nr:unnamed protein product [Strongylus vulgaris]
MRAICVLCIVKMAILLILLSSALFGALMACPPPPPPPPITTPRVRPPTRATQSPNATNSTGTGRKKREVERIEITAVSNRKYDPSMNDSHMQAFKSLVSPLGTTPPK